LTNLEESLVGDPRTQLAGPGGRRVDPEEAPEVADFPFVYEHSVIQPQGTSTPRMVGGNVGRVVFVVSCSEFGDGWSWNEVNLVVSAQASKIREALTEQ
jgi:hypothetical protein